ncbi:MAG: radical SAM protein [Desulfovibrio sp. S3730MH75]|nr:MAG: radical SAM protein [Desulfovibrio sp. S3730MH75]
MSKDPFRIDSHKLLFHPERVAQWMDGENIYPLYMELSPTGACNHRCRFCGLDFVGYKPDFLATEMLKPRLAEMGRLGVKSIMYAGEGEPFLHKDMGTIIQATKDAGIDVALTTNAVLMDRKISENIMGKVSWIKVSMNAGTADTYAYIHGTQKSDFAKVVKNLEDAVDVRKEQKSNCTLGVQIVLLPENANEVESLVVMCRNIGIDYLVVKPYSHHPQSGCDKYKDIEYTDYSELSEKISSYNSESFEVVFRSESMKIWDGKEHSYNRCHALPFWSYIDAKGNVWGCSIYLQDDRFIYGNIYKDDFESIWGGEKRKASMAWCRDNLDPHNCRVNCRMDKINSYLWELINPHDHVNFI